MSADTDDDELTSSFWAEVTRTPGCWEWTGPTFNGYGRFGYEGRRYPAHRMSYLLTYGDLPSRARLCHACENRLCVRPEHLYVGTRGDTRHIAKLRSRDHIEVFWAHVRKSAECWEWTGLLDVGGYGRFAPARGTDVKAHRFSWELHHGSIPDGVAIRHSCGNRKCVRLLHLFQRDKKPVASRARGLESTTRSSLPRGAPRLSLTPEAIEAKFWSVVAKTNGCWEWKGLMSESGYGRFVPARSRFLAAHRYSYELAHGPIPPGKVVCHNCPGGDNRRCVNPAHLFVGTQRENILDASRKGRLVNQQKTHCAQGHPLTGDNVRPRYDHNGRQCVTCARDGQKRTNRARRARGLR
jgi:hypothetical protein